MFAISSTHWYIDFLRDHDEMDLQVAGQLSRNVFRENVIMYVGTRFVKQNDICVLEDKSGSNVRVLLLGLVSQAATRVPECNLRISPDLRGLLSL